MVIIFYSFFTHRIIHRPRVHSAAPLAAHLILATHLVLAAHHSARWLLLPVDPAHLVVHVILLLLLMWLRIPLIRASTAIVVVIPLLAALRLLDSLVVVAPLLVATRIPAVPHLVVVVILLLLGATVLTVVAILAALSVALPALILAT